MWGPKLTLKTLMVVTAIGITGFFSGTGFADILSGYTLQNVQSSNAVSLRKKLTEADRTTVAIARGAQLLTICTGTTIGISHVLTSAHCVWDWEEGKLKEGLSVVPGLHIGGAQKLAPRFFIRNVYVLNDYIDEVEARGLTSYASSKDIAIIQVRETKPEGYYDHYSHRIRVDTMERFKMRGQKLSLLGYSNGKDGLQEDTQYFQHETCRTLSQDGNYTSVFHDCITSPGSSGMAIITEDTDGYGTIIGVHMGKSGMNGDTNKAAIFTQSQIDEIYDKVLLFERDGLSEFRIFDYQSASKENAPYVGYEVRNSCSDVADVQIFYTYLDGSEYVKSLERISPGELRIFSSKTEDISIKYRAVVDGLGQISRSDVDYVVNGVTYGFENLSFPNLYTDNQIVLC